MSRFSRAVLFTALSACGPSWKVLRQSRDVVVAKSAQLAVETSTFDDVTVSHKPEGDWLSSQSEEEQDAWLKAKNEFATMLATTVQQSRGALDIAGPDELTGRYSIRSHVTAIDPGLFDGFYNRSTSTRTRVALTDPNGTALDDIEIKCTVLADVYRPKVSTRLAECGRVTALAIVGYLKQRTHQ